MSVHEGGPGCGLLLYQLDYLKPGYSDPGVLVGFESGFMDQTEITGFFSYLNTDPGQLQPDPVQFHPDLGPVSGIRRK